MPQINPTYREITCKIVYYGPGFGGKTTNLQLIHSGIPAKHRGNLVSLATEQDQTLFFDFLPLDFGDVKGYKTKFQLYTVPGQVYYNATRKLVLRDVDGIVFVADSQATRLRDSIESFENLIENLREHDRDLMSVPVVLQFNKRDLPTAVPVEDMVQHMNPHGRLVAFEAVATEGTGVRETLREVCSLVLKRLNEQVKDIAGEEMAIDIISKMSEGDEPAKDASTARMPTASGGKAGPMLRVDQQSKFFWNGLGVGGGKVTLDTNRTIGTATSYSLETQHKILGLSRGISRSLKYIGEETREVDGIERSYYVLRDADSASSKAPVSVYVENAKLPRIYLVYPGIGADMKTAPEGEQSVF